MHKESIKWTKIRNIRANNSKIKHAGNKYPKHDRLHIKRLMKRMILSTWYTKQIQNSVLVLLWLDLESKLRQLTWSLKCLFTKCTTVVWEPNSAVVFWEGLRRGRKAVSKIWQREGDCRSSERIVFGSVERWCQERGWWQVGFMLDRCPPPISLASVPVNGLE